MRSRLRRGSRQLPSNCCTIDGWGFRTCSARRRALGTRIWVRCAGWMWPWRRLTRRPFRCCQWRTAARRRGRGNMWPSCAQLRKRGRASSRRGGATTRPSATWLGMSQVSSGPTAAPTRVRPGCRQLGRAADGGGGYSLAENVALAARRRPGLGAVSSFRSRPVAAYRALTSVASYAACTAPAILPLLGSSTPSSSAH
jgi:hypothetical protein